MSENSKTTTSIEMMGRIYQIKCNLSEVESLQNAAKFLEEKMSTLNAQGLNNMEKIAIIVALNITNLYLTLLSNYEQEKESHLYSINQRLLQLDDKLNSALFLSTQMELESEE